ncbi:glycosyltransferase family 4 protein [Luteibaculum oceani]|uniref:Glycosyltransferase n=1 Tax=Luteibaculum oceani TaxID=1294296 RepID=A0A5C6US77_9FLAO|nr:glycosyltransferase family 4 protein [Luteibaculum oceani]TXC76087.1 glycosyltransferase [Luteibaculum oceani]
MRILQLTVKPPYPAVDGGCIAIKNFSDIILEGGHELKILSLATHKHPFVPEEIPADFREKTDIEAVYVKTEINFIDAFSSFITMDSYNISRFYSVDFDALLEETLLGAEYDIVQLESLFMTPYISTIRRNSQAKVLLRSHNFEHSIWEQIAAREDVRFKRWYLKFLASRLKNYELEIMDSLDGVIAISTADEKRYKNLKTKRPVSCIPFGIEIDDYPFDTEVNKIPKLFHLGAMDWQPNIDGIHWFLKQVWPDLSINQPQAELHLGGRAMNIEEFKGYGSRVFLEGEVESATDFMLSNDIMVVPLHTGGGIRIKILEGMAMGKTVVSTSIGAEGIHANDGEEIFIANSANEFVDILNKLLTDREKVREVGINARSFVQRNFNKSVLRERYESFCIDLTRKTTVS